MSPAQPMSSRKVAIVTGSATGVGAAAAIMLAERGCNVVINYTRSKAEAEETARACQQHGAETIVFQGDVGEESACQGMAKAAVDKWGRIDYLINNAAKTKFNPYENLDGLTADDGWLTLVGLYWLKRGANRFGSDPGLPVILPKGKAPAHVKVGPQIYDPGST